MRHTLLAITLLLWSPAAWAAPSAVACQAEQDATVYTLEACTVPAGALVVLTVISKNGSAPGVPSVGGATCLSWRSGVTGSTAFCALGGSGATVTVDYSGVGDGR